MITRKGLPARHFVDAEGRYLGAFAAVEVETRLVFHDPQPPGPDGEVPPPVAREVVRVDRVEPVLPPGAVEVDSPPPSPWRTVWNGKRWTADLAALRKARLAEVDDLYQAKLAEGVAFGGKTIQVREQDMLNLVAALAIADDSVRPGRAWPAGFAWRAADNGFVPLPTPEDLRALVRTAQTRVLELRRVMWQHKDAIRSLTTAAKIEAYDITARW